MAALAVAMIIAMAATSTRSDRDIASLRFMRGLNFFRLWVSLVSSDLVYFAFAFCRPFSASLSHLLFRLRCFDFANSSKSSEWFQHEVSFCQPRTESSNKIFILGDATNLHG
jgi:hypothetical protein